VPRSGGGIKSSVLSKNSRLRAFRALRAFASSATWRMRRVPANLATAPPAGVFPRGLALRVCSQRIHAASPMTDLHPRKRILMKFQKTYSPKPADIQRAWFVVDADTVPLGRLASRVAQILRGKHKPIYAPHADTGDYVIVINAEKVAVTSDKSQSKIYYRHSGYPGGLKEESFDRLKERRPEAIIERAVRGMLPKNSLGRQMLRKLRVVAGSEHPHGAQNPEVLDLNIRKVDS
jgi:large subunit ribosomal protein L13